MVLQVSPKWRCYAIKAGFGRCRRRRVERHKVDIVGIYRSPDDDDWSRVFILLPIVVVAALMIRSCFCCGLLLLARQQKHHGRIRVTRRGTVDYNNSTVVLWGRNTIIMSQLSLYPLFINCVFIAVVCLIGRRDLCHAATTHTRATTIL